MAVPSVAVVLLVSAASAFSSSAAVNSSSCPSLCACSAKDGTVKYLQTVLQQFAREKVPNFSPDPFYGNFYS
jgi:hypothetical protein